MLCSMIRIAKKNEDELKEKGLNGKLNVSGEKRGSVGVEAGIETAVAGEIGIEIVTGEGGENGVEAEKEVPGVENIDEGKIVKIKISFRINEFSPIFLTIGHLSFSFQML